MWSKYNNNLIFVITETNYKVNYHIPKIYICKPNKQIWKTNL